MNAARQHGPARLDEHSLLAGVRAGAARSGSVVTLSMMMLDVLSQLPEIKVCVAYELDGQRIDNFPSHVDDLRRVKPIYETLPGWQTDVTSVRRFADLPAGCAGYLEPHQRAGWPARRDRLGRPRPGANDGFAPLARVDLVLRVSTVRIHAVQPLLLVALRCLRTSTPLPAFDVPRRAPAAARRDHHGRQRPLGRSGSICRGSKGTAAAWPACGARSRKRARLQLEQLTLYCLSSENWKRPQRELDFLMHLLEQYMIEERATIMRAEHPRRRSSAAATAFPQRRWREMDKTIELSAANTGMRLCLAINYGGRAEIVDAVRRIAEDARGGPARSGGDRRSRRSADHLYTAGMPDPDLLIRTAGEMRISNFLLWQISYAELWVTERCWPEFEIADLHQAIRDFARRNRRFGGLAT